LSLPSLIDVELVEYLFILLIHAFCLTLAICEVTLEAPQNALLGALQTQEKATFVQQHGTKEDSNTALAPQSGNYQDQQGNHNMFPRSSSMMPPSTGFELNQQNYPEMHGVGGLPQSSAQPCLIKPQPLVLAHDDAQKMNFNSKKLFGIHLDSSAKPELLKSPPSVLYDGMPQTPEAAECRQPDTTEVEKCSDPIMTLKQLDASQVYCGPEKYLSCVQQSRSCKKVRFLVFIYLVFNS
jgi:hypothetical protein